MYGVINTVTMADSNGSAPIKPSRKRSSENSDSTGAHSNPASPNANENTAGFTAEWREGLATRAAVRSQQVVAADSSNPSSGGRRIESSPHQGEMDEEERE